jgi:hypothetical protein
MTVRWVGYLIGLMLAPWACLCVLVHALRIWVGAAWDASGLASRRRG